MASSSEDGFCSLTEDDMLNYMVSVVDYNGLITHNIKAFNELLDKGIPMILKNMFQIHKTIKNPKGTSEEEKDINAIDIDFEFKTVDIGTPKYATYPMGKIMPLYPNNARVSKKTYTAPLFVSMFVKLTAYRADGKKDEKIANISPFKVMEMPIMVGCNKCHTWGLTREARKALGEDPNELGGYFLAKGIEWAIEELENILYNSPHIYLNIKAGERVRGELLSQPSSGGYQNSSHIVIRVLTNGALVAEINSIWFSEMKIPFYIIYRLFGITSDLDILESIVYDSKSESPVIKRMIAILETAFRHKDPVFSPIAHEVNREKIIEFMGEKTSSFVTDKSNYKTSESAIQYLNSRLLDILDKVFMPHMGTTKESRIPKLRYFGTIIHKILLVDMGILEESDRDSYSNKRVHGAAISLAKAFKMSFNTLAVSRTLRALQALIQHTAFNQINESIITDTVKTHMFNINLARVLEQSITSGNKDTIIVNKRPVSNRMSSHVMDRKNHANYIKTLRSIKAAGGSKVAKQTERADKMRRVHESYLGYICIAESADTGEAVGMSKGLGVTATITSMGDIEPLIARLIEDPLVIPLKNVYTPDIIRRGLSSIYVNGQWIGCCEHSYELVDKYRKLRRQGVVVDYQTSISWNCITDDVTFYLDAGRLIRPLIIVDNNLEEYNVACRAAFKARQEGKKDWENLKVPFKQWIGLTKEHVIDLRSGHLKISDLQDMGIIEWIAPEESENCLIAPSITVLQNAQHNVVERYTHCDVKQAIFGLTALISPFANHTQPARVIYETNQGRSSGGWYCSSYPWRIDKNRFFQYGIEVPVTTTIAQNWTPPNGFNVMVAYMVNRGYNQEDSAIIKESFVRRGGFAGAFYKNESAELSDKNEYFATPDPATTKNMKPNTSYEKLVDGFITRGTIVYRGDVLIGRIAKIPSSGAASSSSSSEYKFIDRSIVYRSEVPAIVDDVIHTRGPNDNELVIVKLRYNRYMIAGDKTSSREGNKSIVSLILPEKDMPYDENGITPDLIINPHALPTRMTIGQMMEVLLSIDCQEKGVISDCTAFKTMNTAEMEKELENIGLRYSGLTRLYNGLTGEHYDAAIFMGPTFYQRIQKFVEDNKYSVGGYCPTNATTGQPLEGKSAGGGLKIGEMENWVFESHGAAMMMAQKMFKDSDGCKQYVCRTCGRTAVYNEYHKIYKCHTCEELADIAEIDSARTSEVFRHEIDSCGIKTITKLRPREFEKI